MKQLGTQGHSATISPANAATPEATGRPGFLARFSFLVWRVAGYYSSRPDVPQSLLRLAQE